MATSKIGRAFDYKIVDVSGVCNVKSGSRRFDSVACTSSDFTNAVNDGYVPIGISGWSTGSYLWYMHYAAITSTGASASVTRDSAAATSSNTMTIHVYILMVKSLA